MTDFAICALVFALAIILSAAIVNRLDRKGRGFWRIVLLAGIPPAGVRIAILWYVVYLNASGRGSYDHILFVFLFAPEALMLPTSGTGTGCDYVIASGALAVGSYLWTVLLVLVIQSIRRYPNRHREE